MPSLPSTTLLHAAPAHVVVRELEGQLLEGVADEGLNECQQGELLAWARDHLLSAYVGVNLDAGPIHAPARTRLVRPCRSTVDMIAEMLQAGVPLGEDLGRRCPPAGCPRALALSRALPAWLRRRLVLAAQRTRLHPEAELTALWQDVQAHLITGALAYYGLTEWMAVDVPSVPALRVITYACLDAAHGQRGADWTPAGVRFKWVAAPPAPGEWEENPTA